MPWVALLPSSELTAAGPLRRIEVAGVPMGLVAYRDAEGRLGVFLEACPHVGKPKATLATAQAEADGFRCKFHGWKFDVEGTCVDVPDVPKHVDFSRYPRATCLPAREEGGVIWVQVGAAS